MLLAIPCSSRIDCLKTVSLPFRPSDPRITCGPTLSLPSQSSVSRLFTTPPNHQLRRSQRTGQSERAHAAPTRRTSPTATAAVRQPSRQLVNPTLDNLLILSDPILCLLAFSPSLRSAARLLSFLSCSRVDVVSLVLHSFTLLFRPGHTCEGRCRSQLYLSPVVL